MKNKVNILGSCISRVIMLDGDRFGHGIADNEISMDYYLDKQNVVCALMPPPFSREEVEEIQAEELYDGSRLSSLKQCLNKDTVKLLRDSDAEWLILDFYDFQTQFTIYQDTTFANCAFEFYNTSIFKKRDPKLFQRANFCEMPPWLWYSYVDLFFQQILDHYDADHIILNRFRSNTYYLMQSGRVAKLPDQFKMPYHSNDRFNAPLRKFEDAFIERYHPYVIDLSHFFMGDQNHWDNLNGAHFEHEFYRESFDAVREIILGGSKQRVWNKSRLMDFSRRGYEEDRRRKFDVERGLQMIEQFVEQGDWLWLNLLDKLVTYAPQDARVKRYLALYENAVAGK